MRLCTMKNQNGLQYQKWQLQFNCTIVRRICGKHSLLFCCNMDNLHVSICLMKVMIKKFLRGVKYSILENNGFSHSRQLENVHILTNLCKPQEICLRNHHPTLKHQLFLIKTIRPQVFRCGMMVSPDPCKQSWWSPIRTGWQRSPVATLV